MKIHAIFACGMLALFVGHAQAATVNAKSVSYNDVSKAVASASDGDTVIIPPGGGDWTNVLAYSTAITLKGAGIGQTIITNDVISVMQSAMVLTTSANKFYRITGLEFVPGIHAGPRGQGEIQVQGATTTFRVDHCDFTNTVDTIVRLSGSVCGVIDHNIMFMSGNSGFLIENGLTWAGAQNGDGSWATPPNYGSSGFVVMEDNQMTFTSFAGSATAAATDGYGGARFVFRYNSITNMHVDCHGTGSSGRLRGTRALEIYMNTIVETSNGNGGQAIDVRSGSGVVFSNTIIGPFSIVTTLQDYRSPEAFPTWCGADGTNAWDLNSPTLYFSGTNSSPNGSTYCTQAGANWTPNQWVGYSLRNLSQLQPGNAGVVERFQPISSNTSDTIYMTQGSSHYGLIVFANGDLFEIRHIDRLMDGCGNSSGDLLSSSQTPTPVWLNQTNEMFYSWGNTLNGVDSGIVANSSTIREGIDFINDTVKPGYTPLVYPHPLVTPDDNGDSILPPTNLRIITH